MAPADGVGAARGAAAALGHRGAAAETAVKLVLPYPVSANRYWRTFPYIDKKTKKPMAVTVPSSEAKAYKEECGWRAKVAGFKEPSSKPIEIASITLCPRMNKDGSASATVLDLGNCWKVVEDALQGVVYVNDKQIKRIRDVGYGEPTAEGALVIDVVEFVPGAAPLFALALEEQPVTRRAAVAVPEGMPF